MGSAPRRGVAAGPVRTHLRRFVRRGATSDWIAQRTGVSERTVRSVLNGERPTLYAGTAAALLALNDAPGPARRRVDPGPTIARVRSMTSRRWQVADIADMAGLSPSTLMPSSMASGVSEQTEFAVRVVWERLEGRPGTAAQTYPRLAQDLSELPVREVADGTGLCRATVERLRAGAPVTRRCARVASTWLRARQLER